MMKVQLSLCVVLASLALTRALLLPESTQWFQQKQTALKSRGEGNVLPLKDLDDHFPAVRGRRAAWGSLGSREKRDGDDCGLRGSLETSPQFLQDSSEAIQAIWLGKDEILIIASGKDTATNTTVSIGKPKALVGLFTFTPVPNAIAKPVAPDTLQVSPADDRRTAVVVSHDRHSVFVSRDTGQTWDEYSTPASEFNPSHDLYLSRHDPRNMALLTEQRELFVTNNWGQSWRRVSSGVSTVQFASMGSVEYLYYLTGPQGSTVNKLSRLEIGSGQSAATLDEAAYRFRLDGKFLFVSRKQQASSDAAQRKLFVSVNYESPAVSFSEAQLPSLMDTETYVVMGTHESGAFIHVQMDTQDVANSRGKLYVSDSSGSRFSLSLNNHLFTVVQFYFTSYAVYDFLEVASMRGVYVTTVVVGDDDSHVTMITYDSGGMWQRLPAPEGKCSDGISSQKCSLHLHLRYSKMVAPQFNVSAVSDPLALETAPGIIISHGSVGEFRDDANPGLFITSDGGYTWKDVGVPQGTYVYGIADYGNIVAVARDGDHVESIWISHNRGGCFAEQEFDTSSYFSLSRGLLIDPSAASLFAFVMGVEGVGEDDQWRIIVLNFGSLLRRQCQQGDYHLVWEHESADHKTCVLGYRNQYNLTLDQAVCYNPKGYQYAPVNTESCACGYSDLECDYGFLRTGPQTCTREQNNTLCPPGTKYYNASKSGLRKIPGDKCSDTKHTTDILTVVKRSCGGILRTSLVVRVFAVFGIVVASLLSACCALYLCLKCRQKPMARERVYYQRLPLSDTKFAATDDSSSDEDLLTPS